MRGYSNVKDPSPYQIIQTVKLGLNLLESHKITRKTFNELLNGIGVSLGTSNEGIIYMGSTEYKFKL